MNSTNWTDRLRRSARPLAHNRRLMIGLILLLALIALGILGRYFVDIETAQPISVPTNLPPSAEYPLGTDSGGRNLLAVIVVGTPQTLRLGLIAALVGVVLGTACGLIAGFYGGKIDSVIRSIVDTMLTIPALAILLVVAASMRTMSVEMMALIIAALAWMPTARTVRAQVLTLKERPYVQMSRLSGLSSVRIIVEDILPGLLPYVAASFVGACAGAILAGIGLEMLGLGPQRTPTLGMTIYWSMLYSALIRGMWWWWLPPILILMLLFVSLFLISTALDEIANPRLQRSA